MGFEEVNLNWIVIVSSGALLAVTVMKFWNFWIVGYLLFNDTICQKISLRSYKYRRSFMFLSFQNLNF
jgi:hypothetical protein